MKLLVDTNILSDPSKPQSNGNAEEWIGDHERDLYTSTLVTAELLVRRGKRSGSNDSTMGRRDSTWNYHSSTWEFPDLENDPEFANQRLPRANESRWLSDKSKGTESMVSGGSK